MSIFSEFEWSWRGVRVRETGAQIAFTRDLVWDVWRGSYYILREALRRRPAPLPLKIAYAPKPPRPWYLLWGALRQAGVPATPHSPTPHSPETAALTIHFFDQTLMDNSPPTGRTLNGHCTDISKSHVAKMFAATFGYELSLDPSTAEGPYLEKGEENGVHDAQIRESPTPPITGRVYQKLLDNKTADGTVLDLRCPTVFGTIPVLFLKERPVDKRFANLNTRVRLARPEDYFSEEELSDIKAFCAAMHLDWGGLDILRHAGDGKIYIVDVNKTDMGPPLALPIKDKLSAVKTLGLALRDALKSQP
jgi:hypothetical protein